MVGNVKRPKRTVRSGPVLSRGSDASPCTGPDLHRTGPRDQASRKGEPKNATFCLQNTRPMTSGQCFQANRQRTVNPTVLGLFCMCAILHTGITTFNELTSHKELIPRIKSDRSGLISPGLRLLTGLPLRRRSGTVLRPDRTFYIPNYGVSVLYLKREHFGDPVFVSFLPKPQRISLNSSLC